MMSQFEEFRKESIDQRAMTAADVYGSSVYVVAFSDGWLKVGRGKSPEARMQAHEAVSRMRGAIRVSSAVSGRLVDAKSAESQLIAFCREQGKAEFGNEWFSGVDFHAVAGLIRDRFSGDSAAAFEQEKERLEKAVQKVVDGVFRNTRHQNGVDLNWIEAMGHARVIERILIKNESIPGSWLEEVSTGLTFCALTVSLAVYEMDDDEIAALYEGIADCPGDCLQSMESTVKDLVYSGRYSAGNGEAA